MSKHRLHENYFFTSESVSMGHPDKVADQLSDAILDSLLAKDNMARVACETVVTTGLVIVSDFGRKPGKIEVDGKTYETFTWEKTDIADKFREAARLPK